MPEQKLNANNSIFLDGEARDKLNIVIGDYVELYNVRGALFVVKKGTSSNIAVECLQALKKDIERKEKLEENRK